MPAVRSTRRRLVRACLAGVLGLWLLGCTGVPDGLTPVGDFQVERYLGTWYEIARFDHSFERGLSRVTATYEQRDDGTISVVNRGFNTATGKWDEAAGKARFAGAEDVASLEVSFFGPFYGGYHVIVLDHEGYAYAVVSGPSRDYLWILARRPELSQDVVDALVAKASQLGFATRDLIFVEHAPAG